MSYIPVDPNKIKVGDPITKELLDLIKDNFQDHEDRINNFEAGAIKIPVFEFEIVNNTLTPDMTGLAYYTAIQDFTISECYIQIFTVNGMNSVLEVDVLKSNTDLADLSFASIFTTKPKITMSGASDYDKSTNQVFGAGQAVLAGEVLRLDLTTLPSNKIITKFLIVCYGEI